MRRIGLLALGLTVLIATGSCKRKNPEPIPGPKAGAAIGAHFRVAGIAYFQGGLEEAFARARDAHRPAVGRQARPHPWDPICPNRVRTDPTHS